jgi:hypothetical protein
MTLKLQTDHAGNVITQPLTGYATKPVANRLGLLVLQYAPTPESIEIEEKRQQVQIVMTPTQGLELGRALTTLSEMLLQNSEKSTQH